MPGLLNGVKHGFEGAHDDHVVEHVHHALGAVALELRVEVENVLVDGDLGELDPPGRPHLRGINDE